MLFTRSIVIAAALMTSVATVSPPPSVPAPMPRPNVSSYLPLSPPAQTWGQTPYAPMIAPAMRSQPTTFVNPMIPPVGR